MTVTCVNPDCTENGIPKGMAPGGSPPPADVVIRCGVCGAECVRSDTEPEPEPEPPPVVNPL